MIMGSIGRIRSFTISKRILLWATLFMLFYLIISLYLINRFIDVRARYRTLSERVGKTEEDYTDMKKALVTAQQHASNLEAYIETTTEQKVSATPAAAAPGAGATATGSDLEKVNEGAVKTVEIEGVNIKKTTSGGVVIDFKLVNMTSDNVGINGYLHIIVNDKEDNYPAAWNTPSGDIKNGMPADFKSGEHFFIQRFKQCHREFIADNSSGPPVHIRILAYDPSGNLLLKREYEVSNVS